MPRNRPAVLLAVAIVWATGWVSARQHDDLGRRIDDLLRAEMTRQRIPGVAIGIVKNGAVLKAQGYGLANVEHDVPVTPETIFQSGSLGKQFTSAGVML